MSVISMVRKSAVAAGAVAMLAGLGVATAGTANASSPHRVEVCAHGNYKATVEIPQAGKTFDVDRGTCGHVDIPGNVTFAKVYGHYNNHPDQKFYVGTVHLDAAQGWSGGAVGSTTSPKLQPSQG